MELSKLLSTLRRRWAIALAGLLLTAGAVYASVVLLPQEYTTRGIVLLLPSSDDLAEGANPLLGLGDLELPARVLVAEYQSKSAETRVHERFPDSGFVVEMEASTRGPLISVEANGTSADGALNTLNFIVNDLGATLENLQEQVQAPRSSWVTSTPLTVDRVATPDLGTARRAAIALATAGFGATIVFTFAIDRALLTRRGRRAAPGGTDRDAGDLASKPRRAGGAAGDEQRSHS